MCVALEQMGFNLGQIGLAAAQRQAAQRAGAAGKQGRKKGGSRGGGKHRGGGRKGSGGGRSASEDAIRKACTKGDVNAILSSELLAQALQQDYSDETCGIVLSRGKSRLPLRPQNCPLCLPCQSTEKHRACFGELARCLALERC